jgi:hypothetical protein
VAHEAETPALHRLDSKQQPTIREGTPDQVSSSEEEVHGGLEKEKESDGAEGGIVDEQHPPLVAVRGTGASHRGDE